MLRGQVNAVIPPGKTTHSAAEDRNDCPRCGASTTERVEAPDGSGAWFIGTCEHCCFSWRSTEDTMQVLETTKGNVAQLRNSEIAELPIPVPVTSF